MFYLLIVKKSDNRFIVHGSQTKTWLLKNQNKFLNKTEDYSRYPHLFKAFDGELPKRGTYNPAIFCVVEKYTDGTFDVPFIAIKGGASDCKRYVYEKSHACKTMQERKDYKYNIVYLTSSNYDDFEEDERWLNHTDKDGRIQCYFEKRSSSEYDIYSTIPDEEGSTHLGYVDNYRELKEFFEEDTCNKDRYFCLDI